MSDYFTTSLVDMLGDAYKKPGTFFKKATGPLGGLFEAIPGFLPGAGMFESQEYGKKMEDQFRRNNYLAALGLLGAGMATAGVELVPGGSLVRGTTKTIRSGARQQQPTMPSTMMRGETGGGDPSTLGAGMVVRPYATTKMAPDAPAELDAGLVVKAPKNYEPKKIIKPEDFPVGGYFTQLYGDRSNVGDLIETASGRLDSPLELQGGQGFLRNKATGIWASHPGPMTGISKRVKVASEEGKPVYGVFSPMAGQSTDFARMTTDLMLDKLSKSEPTKAAIKKFNKEMKTKHDDFPGVMSEKLDDWLAETGNHRYDLSKVMAKGEYKKAGFPDFAEIRHAIQDPELRDLEFGMSPLSGQSIGKLDEAGTLQPSIHRTYPVEMPGEYVGGFDVPIPRGMIFRDWFDARRLNNPGASAAHEGKSFMGSHIMQPIDQQLIDTLMTYRNKRLTE